MSINRLPEQSCPVFNKLIRHEPAIQSKNQHLVRGQLKKQHLTHTAVKRGARAQFPLKFSKIFAFKPKVKTVAEKLSFKLHIWPGHLVMDILKSSQLVIFSHSTIFITFSYRSLAGFLFKVRGGENRKWRWIFAFDRCVHLTSMSC